MNPARCARPACPGKPAAWLAYDYDARCAWLDDETAGGADPSHRWPLCERHADSLRVPRGWFSVDRRAARLPGHNAQTSQIPPGAIEDGRPGPSGPGAGEAGPAAAGGQLSAIL